jgi:predicted transcriptional regulator
MRPSRGMGAIKKTKIPGATKNTMPKGVVKKRRDNTDFTQFKEGGPVGLYANINARKKKGTSRAKSKSTITPEAYANMKAGFPKGKK